MEHELLERTAIVTGASRGLGREVAKSLVQRGANLALVARSSSALEEAAIVLRSVRVSEKQKIVSYPVDLRNSSEIQIFAASCRRDFSGIDILVNNAAIQGPIGPFEKLDFDAWENTFKVDFLAVARLCQAVIPDMRKRGGGKIINLSGGGATAPRPDFSAYAAAKTALVRLTETLALELREDHIEVNCVSPGAMNTQMLEEILAAGPEAARFEHARAREQKESGGASLEKAAELIVFLATSASNGITGRLLSAIWDDWRTLPQKRDVLAASDVYTLRRIVPGDRGLSW
jgi:NAD(P)-dependent dehydrogenase (short-subunit alcohol dehydrogenase family)